MIDVELKTLPDRDKLYHVFEMGVEALADGQLKNELTNNFDVYFRQLQR